MGCADIVPGISGGTVAFIMGIYSNLIESIKSVNVYTLCTGRFKDFFTRIAWKYLLALLSGIAFSLATLAHFIDYVLGHETYRILLYSGFLGLILASALFCAKLVKQWRFPHLMSLFVGALAAYLLTGSTVGASEASYRATHGLDPWIILCGAIAVSAMLLPGISGSYLLTILGTYSVVIGALADFVRNFDLSAFYILASMLIGIVIGALLFSHVVSWLLKHFHDMTIALLTGFMIGALKSVWPFWTYGYVFLEKGPQLIVLEPILPDAASLLFCAALAFALLGFAAVFALEHMAMARKRPLQG